MDALKSVSMREKTDVGKRLTVLRGVGKGEAKRMRTEFLWRHRVRSKRGKQV